MNTMNDESKHFSIMMHKNYLLVLEMLLFDNQLHRTLMESDDRKSIITHTPQVHANA